MNRFAELLDRLAYEHGRNAKLRLMTEFFRMTPDPERGYALAALTGALSFPHPKPGLIRALIAERTDPVLFALSYDYVGDLSETVALMWPKPQRIPALPPPNTFAPHIADKILNHQAGTISGVAAVYQRHEFLAERRAALDLWGAHIGKLLGERTYDRGRDSEIFAA